MGLQATEGLLLKQGRLLAQLSELDSLLIAFSGGADSAYLAWAAHQTLGTRALSVTALSASFSAHDRAQAEAFVAQTGIRQEFLDTREMENPLYVANAADRCYHCKSELFTRLDELARSRGFSATAYGVNADDIADFRPGHRAASEHHVLRPLLDAGMTKAEIRALSRHNGLATWDRPASPCLSSRIPYGTPVTIETLSKVERAEAILRELGYREFRVRFYGETARLEVSCEEMPRALAEDIAASVAERFRAIGFASVTLDPAGYRQGSLNTALPAASRHAAAPK